MTIATPTRQIDFSCRLLRPLLRQGKENVFISPATVAFGLGMAASGARGKTLVAIENTIGLDTSCVAELAQRYFTSTDRLPPGLTVELANSVWARKDLTLSAAYCRALRQDYRAVARSLDFTHQGAQQAINEWVGRATHGQISGVIDWLAPDDALILISAAYFHGLWNDPFKREETVDHAFTTPSGDGIPVRLMTKSVDFAFMEDSQVQAVVLPYLSDRFHMLVVLPRERLSVAAFDQLATPTSLARIIGELKEREGFLGLPRVTVEWEIDLKPALSEMGIARAFTADADFSGMFDRSAPAYLSKALSKALLSIDEEGTTAAAVFAATVTEWLAVRPFEMIVDHPFLFLLAESDTGLPLYIGVIGNPTPARPQAVGPSEKRPGLA